MLLIPDQSCDLMSWKPEDGVTIAICTIHNHIDHHFPSTDYDLMHHFLCELMSVQSLWFCTALHRSNISEEFITWVGKVEMIHSNASSPSKHVHLPR